jgi:hypothetical protein
MKAKTSKEINVSHHRKRFSRNQNPCCGRLLPALAIPGDSITHPKIAATDSLADFDIAYH